MAPLLPSWSPDGQWIAYAANDGWYLISPDGAEHRRLAAIVAPNPGFLKDGRMAYGIRSDNTRKHCLFSLDIATAAVHDIRQLDSSLSPASNLNPAIRFTLAPDGRSFAYSTLKQDSSIWMLQGFSAK